ncbi:MAG: phosphoribosylaminoimidazolesuccinocarboxamide synthase [Candidatus Liberibacter ctenarytainae]|uniref:Phosphoribosylaminoimidazole-succinocarboxamide synthase n=1 Tax=Candidatus Liberibacter ctenarytainae TaxID=2020335 RepID=A0A937ASX7_9HYPH|nr:phosphoribosylaminoimidazolesuccinocarboxamide synthase [Candidatus Liberibacter ctenarytainae]
MKILSKAYISELPNYYSGKVRENYFLNNGTRITITTDRMSAFDRNIACIPHKGQILNQTTQYWLQNTLDICQNHALDYPDPNVLVGKQLRMIPIEMIVRGYLAGNTKTSLLTFYKNGHRTICGYRLPNNMHDYQQLPFLIITPTTKSTESGHDQPTSASAMIQKGIITQKQWDTISSYSLSLFKRGSEIASKNNLILVDSKYEFGLDEDNQIILADEIHTPDSSRYWENETYEESLKKGAPPIGLDKDLARHWILTRCDPYKDSIPDIPDSLISSLSKNYITAYEKITGSQFIADNSDPSILNRIRKNLRKYMEE